MARPAPSATRPARPPVIELLARMLVPAIVIVYAIGFLHSIWDLGPKSANYPRVMIALLLPITLWVIIAEYLSWRQRRPVADEEPVPAAAVPAAPDQAGTAQLAPEPAEPSATAHRSRLRLPREQLRTLITIGSFVVFLIAVPRVGFYVSAGVYLLVAMILLGVRNVFALVLLTAGGLIFSYLFFYQLLGLLLPTGALR